MGRRRFRKIGVLVGVLCTTPIVADEWSVSARADLVPLGPAPLAGSLSGEVDYRSSLGLGAGLGWSTPLSGGPGRWQAEASWSARVVEARPSVALTWDEERSWGLRTGVSWAEEPLVLSVSAQVRGQAPAVEPTSMAVALSVAEVVNERWTLGVSLIPRWQAPGIWAVEVGFQAVAAVGPWSATWGAATGTGAPWVVVSAFGWAAP